jgi:hypothetical protein
VDPIIFCRVCLTSLASLVTWAAGGALSTAYSIDVGGRLAATQPTVAADKRTLQVGQDYPCGSSAVEPPRAYPFPTDSAQQLAAMFRRPTGVTELLWNLKLVLDRHLLVQPAFFEDDVLLKLFGGTTVEWVEPGTPDVAGDWVIKPTRIARVTVAGGIFAGMKVNVGLNHKCLNRRIDPLHPGSYIPQHTYDAGYIRLRFEPIDGFTLGAVRRVFGPNSWSFDAKCEKPLPLTYPTGVEPPSDAFLLNVAQFEPDETGYQEVCRSKSMQELPDGYLVRTVSIRLIEEDYTVPGAITP